MRILILEKMREEGNMKRKNNDLERREVKFIKV